jgi:hypothetical protein
LRRFQPLVDDLLIAAQEDQIVAIEHGRSLPAPLEDFLRRAISSHDVNGGSHWHSFLGGVRVTLLLFGFDLQRQLWIHIAAIVASAVRKLGVAALWAADIVNRLKRLM